MGRVRRQSLDLRTPTRHAVLPSLFQFVEDFGAEISEMKLSLKTRARAVVEDFWRELERKQQLLQPQ